MAALSEDALWSGRVSATVGPFSARTPFWGKRGNCSARCGRSEGMAFATLLDDWVSGERSFSGEDSAPDDDLALKLSPPLDLDQFDIIYVILFYHLS